MYKFIFTLFALCSTPLFAQIKLDLLPTTQIGHISQLTVSEHDELFVINAQGELWQATPKYQKLGENFSNQIAPVVAFNRIAAADKQGNFVLWTPEQQYHSTIPLAKHAGMQPLPLATIAVSKQDNQHKLVRIETHHTQAKITATADLNVLPDAHPIQIDFHHTTPAQGHIAILAKPDTTTYLHGVLGDAIEAQEVHYLERHTLKPLATPLSIKGLVFEANRFERFPTSRGTKLVSVMSGNGAGGRTVLINEKNGQLIIENHSEPLPTNRWQSPFVFNQKLYAIQMPHLRGKLVEYHVQDKHLSETFIQDGLSNHIYGAYETNLAGVTEHFTVMPTRSYQHIAILDKQGTLTPLHQKLPAEIHKVQVSKNKAYLLLNNGQIWVVEDK